LPAYRKAIDFPNPDFAALAQACGGHGFTARKPNELKEAVSAAFAIDGPAIVDAVVDSNELPNLPHLELDVVGHVAVAKVKEALLALTGGRLQPCANPNPEPRLLGFRTSIGTRKIAPCSAPARGMALLSQVSLRTDQYGLGSLVVVVLVAAMLPNTPSV